MSRIALIAGRGVLPAILSAALPERPLVCALAGFLPERLAVDQTFRVERLALFLRLLQDEGVTRVCFAGAVERPKLDPALFDPQTAQMVPRLLAAMAQGDDATLREVLAIFEEAEFEIVPVQAIAPGLVPSAGHLVGEPSAQDIADCARAEVIVTALGAVDVGQGAVVANGLCLAVEALPGTDAMLRGVAGLAISLRRNGGVFYKAAKPGQDLRIDLPTLGPMTVELAAKAGLGGIAFQAGGVICLDLPQMIEIAAAKGLFLWAR